MNNLRPAPSHAAGRLSPHVSPSLTLQVPVGPGPAWLQWGAHACWTQALPLPSCVASGQSFHPSEPPSHVNRCKDADLGPVRLEGTQEALVQEMEL